MSSMPSPVSVLVLSPPWLPLCLSLGIDLDVRDYKEHSIGLGRDVKAVTYIHCTAAGSNEQVWGVGIHQDVVQASLIALLSAASSVSFIDAFD